MSVELDEPTMQRLREEGDTPAPLFEPGRICKVCPNVLVRRPGERSNRWLNRECCSKTCSMINRRAKEAAAMVPDEKPCERAGCDVVMNRHKLDVRLDRWRERRYHDDVCRALARRTAGGDARRAGREREQARRAARKAGRTPAPKKPASTPTPAPTDAAPVPAGPPWRPAGWTAWPNTWAGHRPYDGGVA